MASSQNQSGPVFFTCAVHLTVVPEHVIRWDPTGCHPNEEAIEKIHRFCHTIYRVPITWLCSYAALKKYGAQLKQFVHEHGDEVAIYEGGIACSHALDHKPEVFQPWVEECGMLRPDAGFQSKEAEAIGGKCWHDMPYEDQRKALTYLKQAYERTLDAPVRVFASPHTNGDTVRVMSEIGLTTSWGYCWNYFCEGINHKGCQVQPFYISQKNHSVPNQEAGKDDVLAIWWGNASPVIGFHVDIHSRLGGPAFCGNALELANRSEGLDKYDLHRKIIEEVASWAAWNPFAMISLQLEAVWMSESEFSKELYDQYPTFNSTNTEVFYTQIETAMRVGGTPMTMSGFTEWHKKHIGTTAEYVAVSEDIVPEVRNRGKDQAYQPMVVYSDRRTQYFFDKARGFNYTRKYVYDPIVEEQDIVHEYPFVDEPQVYLKVKRAFNVTAGVVITPERVSYELTECELTAYADVRDYAAILWQANLPAYVSDGDLTVGGELKRVRTVREKNLAILFGDLKEGDNVFSLSSDLPGKYVRVVSCERVGRRYEIWIQNDADAVAVQMLKVMTEPGLKVGGYWWDGRYSKTLLRTGPSWYDRWTGEVGIRAVYPTALPLNAGLTRCSIELM
jgi:hypothetical protein